MVKWILQMAGLAMGGVSMLDRFQGCMLGALVSGLGAGSFHVILCRVMSCQSVPCHAMSRQMLAGHSMLPDGLL